MSRIRQAVFVGSACALSWMLMTVSHEFGHALGAWLTGGRVERIVLYPFAISRTDVKPNPRPLVVAWMGPLVGATLPLVLLVIGRRFDVLIRTC